LQSYIGLALFFSTLLAALFNFIALND